MYSPLSGDFLTAIRGDHQAVYKLECLSGSGEVAETLTGVATEGNVNVSRGASRRRVGVRLLDLDQLVVGGTDLTVDQATDLLAPYGQRIRPWRGVRFADGTQEYAPLGTFVLARAPVIRWPVIELEGYDLAWLVAKNPFETSYQIPALTNYVDAIQQLLADRLPSLASYNFPVVAEQTPNLVFDEGADPWEAAQQLATSIGMQLFFDPLGVPTLLPEPDPTTSPVVWELIEGPDCMMTDLAKTLDAEDAVNVIVAIGEHPDLAGPVRGVAEDRTPGSPTHVDNADFGRRSRTIRSAAWTSSTMAGVAAVTELQRGAGVTAQLQITSMVHPGLEAGDVIQVTRAIEQVDEPWVADAFNVPLGRGTMTITTRTRQAALV